MACLANNTSTYVRMVRKKELLTKIDSGLHKSAIYGVKSIEGARSCHLEYCNRNRYYRINQNKVTGSLQLVALFRIRSTWLEIEFG